MRVPQGCGTHRSCKNLPDATTASLRRLPRTSDYPDLEFLGVPDLELLGSGRLVRHIDDLHTAVDVRRRAAGVLEFGLAVSDGHKIGPGNAELVGQVALDRVCTPLRQVLIVSVAADRVGVACDDEG